MTMLRRYTFKMYPNKAQESALHGQRIMCADLWNALLQMREDQHRRNSQKAKEDRRTPTAFDQSKEITKLRNACPEWKVMSADSQAGIAKMLDEAFKAFFRRAKAGAGASSGYPKYKAARLWETIPMREMGKGWKMTGALRLHVKGIPGDIKLRGKLPCDPVSWRNANLIFRDGAWWLSACVEMTPARKPGANSLRVHLDLIDEFARVERVDGAMSVPRESANHPSLQRRNEASPAVTAESGADDRTLAKALLAACPAVTAESGADDRTLAKALLAACPAVTAESGADDRDLSFLTDEDAPAVTAESGADDRGHPFNTQGVTPAVTAESGADDRSELLSGATGKPAVTAESGADDRMLLRDIGTEDPAVTAELGADDRIAGRGVYTSLPAVTAESGADDRKKIGGRTADLEKELTRAKKLTEAADCLKAERDRRFHKRSWRWRRHTIRAKALTGKAARIRREALHKWTTDTVRGASALEVIGPSIKDSTKSARGTARDHGAAVEVNALLHRHVLNQAPATAIQMLEYKAAEAAIPFALVRAEAPAVGVGEEISIATKAARKARRLIRKEVA